MEYGKILKIETDGENFDTDYHEAIALVPAPSEEKKGKILDCVQTGYKLETVISRGDQNTRPRDYYDIYILAKLQYANIEPDALGAALNATTEKRGSSTVVKEYRSIMDTVKSSEVMQKQWKNYQKDFEYATDIALEDACDVVVELMENLGGE